MISFPAPFRAALAICSDLDETPDAETYLELMRFLNTTETTSMGQGVGLEVGNSIYFDMAPGHFSYWNTDEKNREKLRALIQSGHIDCLHSYGDLATTRVHAGRALEELARYGCKIPVWVDHAQAPTNLGSDIMKGHGDEPGHPAYHADLTLGYGIEYVWCGRVTSVIGQERPLSFRGIADWKRAWASGQTLAKEAGKQLLARSGACKYALHAPNRVLGLRALRNGTLTREFLRCNPHPAGVSAGDRGDRIQEVLTDRFLARLVERRSVCILYTHLGKLGRQGKKGFPAEAVKAFRRLAEYYYSGRLLVTTTSRLLRHCSNGQSSSHCQASGAPAAVAPLERLQCSNSWKRLAFPSL